MDKVSLVVLIASYLEPKHVEHIRSSFPAIEVVYRPDLMAKPRYQADHTAPVTRTAAQEAEWRTLLARAHVLFDFDTELFCDNMRRYLAGEPMRNVLDTVRMY